MPSRRPASGSLPGDASEELGQDTYCFFIHLQSSCKVFPFGYGMRVRIFYHDHCFDGAASAAYFSRFLEGKFYPNAEFVYTGMAHRASQLFDESLFDGDENAIVDFKYCSSPKITWRVDHHQIA